MNPFEIMSRRRAGLAALAVAGIPGAALARSTPDVNLSNRTINVRDFSAKGDGQTDDAPAINRAIQAVRRLHEKVEGYDVGCRLIFPAGVYLLRDTLDFTQLRNINTLIDGQGSVLVGCCVGDPVIDALGARWLTLHDLTVMGDSTAVPSIGMQIGRLYHENADDHYFSNLKILGNFSRACIYNRAAETSEFNRWMLWNNQPMSYCLLQDGTNYFEIASKFQGTHFNPRTDSSFNENIFTSCDIRHTAAGIPVWLGDTARHAFIRCYVATQGEAAFVLYSGVSGNSILEIDCHVEWTGVGCIFQFRGTDKRIIVKGLTYIDQYTFANRAIFSPKNAGSEIEIQNLKLEIAHFSVRNCKIFDEGFLGRVSGSVYIPSDEAWNGDRLFTGILTSGVKMRLIGLGH